MSLNWRKGSRRVFALAATGWLGYILFVYPLQKREEASRHYQRGLDLCAQNNVESLQQCVKAEQESLQISVEPYPIPFVLQRDWPSRFLVFGLVVLPPVVAYGLFWFGWLILAWVTRGFRQD
jgi:hypothetical protein